MIYYAPKMKDVDYSDDEFVMWVKRRQRGRRNFCFGIIVLALAVFTAILYFTK